MAKQRKAPRRSPAAKPGSPLPGTVKDDVDAGPGELTEKQEGQPTLKTCTKCKKEKNETDFALTKIRGRIMRRSWCATCMKAYYQAYHSAKTKK